MYAEMKETAPKRKSDETKEVSKQQGKKKVKLNWLQVYY